ncbi:hypothetical protein B0J13DRAFT_154134 [Dactylonectria estremocensis]|uniref:Uncharacterized protein n=1 Tax=Dactylonectria estremocensis TaxID=1079267 RepID=A0A9P9DMI3_9HYPO|nr:hypothetical protein B0J13DRAFT_154134 [Dactylonectria estremocensis]
MSLSLPAVIALSITLPVLVAVFSFIVWYNHGRNNDGLEEEQGIRWDLWLGQPDNATSEADLSCGPDIDLPMAALQQSPDITRPIRLEQPSAPLCHFNIAIYTFRRDQWLELGDPMHVLVPQKPRVLYSFYFNPLLVAKGQDGRLEDIDFTKAKSQSIDQFRATEAGSGFDTEIDGILYERLSDYQVDMVETIARPKVALGTLQVKDALLKLTDDIFSWKTN